MSCTPATHSCGPKYWFGGVAALLPLAGVVDQELGHLAQRAAFLAVVHAQAHAAALRALDAFLDGVREVGAAGADVGAEHVGAVAFVVNASRQFDRGIRQIGRVAEDVQREVPDGRQKHLQIGPRDQFRVHAAGFLEQHAAQLGLAAAKALGHAGQVPHRLHRRLGDQRAAGRQQHLAVGLEPAFLDGLDDLRQDHVRLGHGDGRADVVAGGQRISEAGADLGAPRVERDDLARLAPGRMRADAVGGGGVGQVRPVAGVQRARRHGQRAIHAVAAAVRADHVAVRTVGGGAHHRAALSGRRRAPADGLRALPARVRGQPDVARRPRRPRGRGAGLRLAGGGYRIGGVGHAGRPCLPVNSQSTRAT